MFQYVLLMLVFGGLSASVSFEERVVGGAAAAANKFLFMVSIRSPSRIHICGGTILDTYFILTAASCFTGRDPEKYTDMTVQYGKQEITTDDDKTVSIENVILHEDFDPQTKRNDIAIVILAGDGIPLGGNVKVVSLNTDHKIPSSTEKVTLLGWGFEEHGGDIQKKLRVASLDVYSPTECSALHVKQILSTNICARSRVGNRGPCNGDEGGPLMSNDNKVQVGIVSWSEQPCATKSSPGVYTRVSKYICWINLKTRPTTTKTSSV